MNQLIATVSKIDTHENIHIVQFKYKDKILSMMSLDIGEDIKIGTKVKLVAKATHIALGKDLKGEFSYSNQLQCTIISLENGKLLSSIKLDFYGTTLESIITLNSSIRMNLQVGDKVIAFIKASELSISEIIND